VVSPAALSTALRSVKVIEGCGIRSYLWDFSQGL
jgi:hypothetical protein